MEYRNSLAALLLVVSGIAYQVAPSTSEPKAAAAPEASSAAVLGCKGWETVGDFVEDRHVEFMIATLADPVDTHLSIFFDRGIESIIGAAGNAGYSFDGYWLPWQENPFTKPSTPDVLKVQERSNTDRESHPGVLLFRGPSGKDDLAVFLVGESPTGGIDTDQMKAAVQYIWRGTSDCDEDPQKAMVARRIRIAGPTFSGSLASLAEVIQDTGLPQLFEVVSGSTTSTGAIEQFRKTVPGFEATVQDDVSAMQAFLDRVGSDKVAVLSEGDTAFGAGFKGNKKVYNFPFPRDIARLRNAYDEDFLASPVPDVRRSPEQQTGVTLSLRDASEGDSVPSFSREQTPVSLDVVLQNLATSLRREEIQYAGIVATDPLDIFFLGRFLSANAPNIRLFQIDADLLFVREPESLPLVGMLSVTSYPLFAMNQQWTSDSKDRLIFASRYSQGIYNATLSLLGAKDKMKESGSPWGGAPKPPLWLTAVGRNGYWPIALLSTEGTETKVPEVDEPSHLFVLCIFVLLVVGVVTAKTNWEHKATGEQAPFMLVFGLSLAAMTLCLAGPLWKLDGTSPYLLLCAAALLPTLLFSVQLTWRARRPALVWPWVGFAAFCVVGMLLLVPVSSHEDYFFALRGLTTSSGLSPLPPLIALLAAYALWAQIHWQRLILITERREDLPTLAPPITAARQQVDAVFEATWIPWSRWAAPVLIGGVLLISWPHLHTLEAVPYEVLFNAGLAGLFCLMVLTGCQFWSAWVALERLLDQLELHPIRTALSHLPSDRSLSPIWQGNVRKRSHVLLARSVDCLRAFGKESTEFGELEAAVNNVAATVAEGRTESLQQVHAMEVANRIANQLVVEMQASGWEKGMSETVPPPEPGHPPEATTLAAEFIALRVLAYIRYVMLHLRTLLSFMTVGFLVLTVSLSSYPFQSPQIIAALTLALFGALAALVVWFFARMDANAVLLRIRSGGEGKPDRSLWIQLAETGALPVLAVVASSVPRAGQFLFSWLGPVLDHLR